MSAHRGYLGNCTYRAGIDDLLGGSCERCGHAIALHPGPHNLALETCLICWLLESGGTA